MTSTHSQPAAWADTLLVFDTETTDKDPSTAHIVTATIGRLRTGEQLIESKSWLINPGVLISDSAAAIHGVSNERATAEGMDPGLAARQILDEILRADAEGIPVVAYNAVFDFTVLRHVCETHGVPFRLPRYILDPFVLDKMLDQFRAGRRTLGRVAEVYGVELTDAHDATADAVAAGQIMHKMSTRVAGQALESLMELQPRLADHQQQSLEDHFRKTDPSAVVERGWPLRNR